LGGAGSQSGVRGYLEIEDAWLFGAAQKGSESAVAVGKGVAPLPPAQIPACGFLAPGSSDSLASASTTAIPLSEVDTGSRPSMSGLVFPLRASAARQSLPPVTGVTVSEYYGLIRLPAVFSFPTRSFVSAYLSRVGDSTHVHAQEPTGPPKSLALLSTHPALFADPGRPSEHSPYRALCVGFPSVNTVAICS
jgi:hypothetical protein